MIRLNRVEMTTTIGILAVVMLISGLMLSHWFSSNLLFVPASDEPDEDDRPEIPPYNHPFNNTEEPKVPPENHTTYSLPLGSNIFGEVSDTQLTLDGRITISGVGAFAFEPRKVVTRRPDIFQPGHFSVFDVIAYLDQRGEIAAEYHFDEDMNTYVVDSINGEENWWHKVYYDGGWGEPNVYRMDHYPVKDKMYIGVFQRPSSYIEDWFEAFRDQVSRQKQTEELVIPEVVIGGEEETLSFRNVTVEAHNLRNDTFKPGVITAIDVILSLADQGEISFDLKWYAEIFGSEVKDYYVERINGDKASGRCGFVYECGEKRFKFQGNHIHLPSDIRVINSPEYVEWFWICI